MTITYVESAATDSLPNSIRVSFPSTITPRYQPNNTNEQINPTYALSPDYKLDFNLSVQTQGQIGRVSCPESMEVTSNGCNAEVRAVGLKLDRDLVVVVHQVSIGNTARVGDNSERQYMTLLQYSALSWLSCSFCCFWCCVCGVLARSEHLAAFRKFCVRGA